MRHRPLIPPIDLRNHKYLLERLQVLLLPVLQYLRYLLVLRGCASVVQVEEAGLFCSGGVLLQVVVPPLIRQLATHHQLPPLLLLRDPLPLIIKRSQNRMLLYIRVVRRNGAASLASHRVVLLLMMLVLPRMLVQASNSRPPLLVLRVHLIRVLLVLLVVFRRGLRDRFFVGGFGAAAVGVLLVVRVALHLDEVLLVRLEVVVVRRA